MATIYVSYDIREDSIRIIYENQSIHIPCEQTDSDTKLSQVLKAIKSIKLSPNQISIWEAEIDG